MGKAFTGTEPITVLHYTSGHLDKANPRFAQTVRDQISKSAGTYPIITVSQSPLSLGVHNVVLGEVGRSHLNIYRAILAGALAVKEVTGTEWVGLAEDDILYSAAHWRTHRPPPHKFAYDFSKWGINTWLRPARYGYRSRAVINQLIAPTQLLIDSLQERFDLYPDDAALQRRFGEDNPLKFWGDLGRYEKHLGVTVREWEPFAAYEPSVVFSHEEAFGYLSRGQRKSLGEGQLLDLYPWGSAEKMLDLWLEGYREEKVA